MNKEWRFGNQQMSLAICGLLCLTMACSQENNNVGNQDQSSDEFEIKTEVFTIVEEQPIFPGGLEAFYQYITREIRYPLSARQKGIEGEVQVEFVVEKDGSITQVKTIKGIGSDCDNEVVRVLQNISGFKPGSQRGKPVRVRMMIPIIFKLDATKANPDGSPQGMIIVEKLQSNNVPLKVSAIYSDGVWSGTVLSPEGDELPGVNIIVTGSTLGTVSDLDGTFKLRASESQKLRLSFVGYESVDLVVE